VISTKQSNATNEKVPIYNMEQRGEFPQRFHLTSRCVVWDLAEVVTLASCNSVRCAQRSRSSKMWNPDGAARDDHYALARQRIDA
jgi:hypothetical protein